MTVVSDKAVPPVQVVKKRAPTLYAIIAMKLLKASLFIGSFIDGPVVFELSRASCQKFRASRFSSRLVTLSTLSLGAAFLVAPWLVNLLYS